MKRRVPVVLGVLVAAVAGVTSFRAASSADRSPSYSFWDPLQEVYITLTRRFYKDVDQEKLQEGTIKGMIETLDDPYTEFIPTKDVADFDREVRGEFVGIGAEVRGSDGWLLIASPLDDSPAWKAGVEADDLVIAVDGKSVYNLSVDDIIDRLTGEPNTQVRVTFERVGTETDIPKGAEPPSIPGPEGEARGPKPGSVRFDLVITRQRIKAQTMKGLHRDGDKWDFMADPEKKIAYVRLTQFTATTVNELETVCRQLVDQGVRGMILDLRFNSGGALSAAIGVSDLFLGDPNEVIVKTRGRSSPEEAAYARSEGTLPDFPLIVMVNDASASASEIVAGSLKDNNRAIIVGTRSFGKGLVQSVYRLPSGAGQLKITEARYYLPSGRCIQREDDSSEWGVDPTQGFYVPMSDEEIRAMWRIRRDEEVLRAGDRTAPTDKNWTDPQWILEHLKDTQLAAAVKAIGIKLDSGEWKPTGTEAPHGTLELAAMKREEQRYNLLMREMDRVARRLDSLRKLSLGEESKPEDLIPGDEDLTDGKVAIYDAKGQLITTLKITGPTLEAWLNGGPVAVDPTSAAATPKPTEQTAKDNTPQTPKTTPN